MQATDVVVIGGGVIGCAIAYYLRKWGCEVTILERGNIGGGASSAAAGLLAPLGPLSGPGPLADLLLVGCSLLTTLIPELEEVSGLHLTYEQTGALRVVRNPRRVAALFKRLEAWRQLGLELGWLEGEEARKREPLLSAEICAAVYAPQEAQIAASQVVRAFAQGALLTGARISCLSEVVGMKRQGDKITCVQLADGDQISCSHVVVAAGAWSAYCGRFADLVLPVEPLRGQMLALSQLPSRLRHIIFGEAAYLAPRGEQVLLGATKEAVGFDVRVTTEGSIWLRTRAMRLAPALEQSQVQKSWAGLRPATPDTRPILGPAPSCENVTLATGHNSVGIMLSAITGQTIANLIATGQMSPLIRPFSPGRLATEEH